MLTAKNKQKFKAIYLRCTIRKFQESVKDVGKWDISQKIASDQ
jgi:hypothetical protein